MQLKISSWFLILVGLLAVLVSFVSECWIPYESDWNGYKDDTPRDFAHAAVNEFFNIVSISAWGGLATLVISYLPTIQIWPHNWPLVLQVLMAIVIADIGITLAHFASHKIGFLWRLHAIHHSVTRMYGFNGLMKHPLHQAIEGLAGFAPLLLIGMPVHIAATLAFAVMVNLLLQHSNTDIKMGSLRYVFAFAPVHRFHHLRYGTLGDVNFGFFFNAWDFLLRTSFYIKEYKVRGSDLGISDRSDFPIHYMKQLIDPFNHYKASPMATVPAELNSHLAKGH